MQHRVLITLLLLLFIIANVSSASNGLDTSLPKISWFPYDPTPGIDTPYCIEVWGDYIYVGGNYWISSGDTGFIVAKFSKSTHALVKEWKYNPSSGKDTITGCIADNTGVYLAGYDFSLGKAVWRIIKLDADLNKLYDDNESNIYGDIKPLTMVADENYIYIGGYYISWIDYNFIIEKRFKNNLAIVGTSKYYLKDYTDEGIEVLGINPMTNTLWVMGWSIYNNQPNVVWQAFYKNLSFATSPEYTSGSTVQGRISFDETGRGYAVINGKIATFDKDFNMISLKDIGETLITHPLYVKGYLYAVSSYNLVVMDRNLNIVTKTPLPVSIQNATNLFFDGVNIYFAGVSSAGQWIIYIVDVLKGELSLIVRGGNNGIYYRALSYLDNKWSANWSKLPGTTPTSPAAVESAGRIYIAVRGGDNSIYFSYINCSTGAFSGWIKIGGSTPSSPALAASPDGMLFLVVRGMDNHIYYRVYYPSSNSWSNNWKNIPGSTVDAPAVAVARGILHVVVRGSDGKIWYGQMQVSGEIWLGWTSLPGSTPSAPYLTSYNDVMYLGVRGSDNRIYLRTWDGAWYSWEAVPTGTTPARPALAVYGNTLYIFVQGSDGRSIYYMTKDLINKKYSSWIILPGSTYSAPTLASPP